MSDINILRQMIEIYKRNIAICDLSDEDQENLHTLNLRLLGGNILEPSADNEDPSMADRETYNVSTLSQGSIVRTKMFNGKWHRAESVDGINWPQRWSTRRWDNELDAVIAGGRRP